MEESSENVGRWNSYEEEDYEEGEAEDDRRTYTETYRLMWALDNYEGWPYD